MRDVIATAHALDVSVFPWMIGETDREDYDGHLIRPTDEATQTILRCAGP